MFVALHRTTQLSLPLMVAGTGLPQLPAIAGNAKSYAERLFDFPMIGALSRNDAHEAIRIPAIAEGADVEDAALDKLFDLTRGYAYFVQEWAYHVWNLAPRSPITRSDVVASEASVIGNLDESFFRVRYDRLTPREKRYLRAMAELGEGPHRSGDVAALLGVKVESLAPLRSNLIKKGMIYSPQHGDTPSPFPSSTRSCAAQNQTPPPINEPGRIVVVGHIRVERDAGTEEARTMGTATTQGPLWGAKAKDWSAIQERTLSQLYEVVFDALRIEPGMRLLDIGCGAGLATRIAAQRGATASGFDASEGLLDVARSASSTVSYRAGDMEQLPYDDDAFDVVTGFNAFQYAESIPAALREARRVLKPGGRVVMVAWGPPEHCEHAATLRAAGSCLPPPPPGAPGPFALSADGIIEDLMRDASLQPVESGSVNCAFTYPDADTAWRGISSAGPYIRAIQHAGEPAVKAAVFASLEPYETPSGGYRQENVFRYVIAERVP